MVWLQRLVEELLYKNMWTLGCVLAFLCLAEQLYPVENEYDTLKTIIDLNGRPEKQVSGCSIQNTLFFFYQAQEGREHLWWLKTESEYAYEAGVNTQYKVNPFPDFINMDGLIMKQKERRITDIYEDTIEFISLLKQMLNVKSKNCVTPKEGLKHKFITMKHLPDYKSQIFENSEGKNECVPLMKKTAFLLDLQRKRLKHVASPTAQVTKKLKFVCRWSWHR